MKALIDLPEPGQVLTVWALEHPAFVGLVFLGMERPVPGRCEIVVDGTVLPLRWDESMLVRAQLSCSAWRHLTGPQTIVCRHCHLANGAHDPACPVLAAAQAGLFEEAPA